MIGAGISAAARWAVGHLPKYAVNLILTTPTELWTLDYPETHDLFVLQRSPGGPDGDRPLEHATAAGRIRASPAAAARRRRPGRHPPKHLLTLDGFGAHAATSQQGR